jgi:hypothetical protein
MWNLQDYNFVVSVTTHQLIMTGMFLIGLMLAFFYAFRRVNKENKPYGHLADGLLSSLSQYDNWLTIEGCDNMICHKTEDIVIRFKSDGDYQPKIIVEDKKVHPRLEKRELTAIYNLASDVKQTLDREEDQRIEDSIASVINKSCCYNFDLKK